MYTTIHTQSNIVFTLRQLSQYLSDLIEYHECALKKLLQYMRSTINFDIVYSTSESQVMFKYFNSDYASDKQNCKSILNHVYILDDESVS